MMDKIMVLFVFLVMSSCLFSSHPPTFAHSSHAAPEGRSIIDVGDVVPEVSPLLTLPQRHVALKNGTQRLDGLNCEQCVFKNVTFQYGGGPYRLDECKFEPGTITVVFIGAAANAVGFLPLAESIAAGISPSGPNPLPPPKKYNINTPTVISWSSSVKNP
jgi:hypothetical protein